ncbi:MAG: type II toxin-antitoxin system RelE/ParE family toxin [Devosia indica]
MPHLIVTEAAQADLRRLRHFLISKNPRAAGRALDAIRRHVRMLAVTPEVGRPVPDSRWRELIIPFADAGYVALYRHDMDDDCVVISAIRHQKEAGFG